MNRNRNLHVRQLPPTESQVAYVRQRRLDRAHTVALDEYAATPGRAARDRLREITARQTDETLNATLVELDPLAKGVVAYCRAVILDELHHRAQLDQYQAQVNLYMWPIYAEPAVQNAVHQAINDTPPHSCYSDPAVQAAIHRTIQEQQR